MSAPIFYAVAIIVASAIGWARQRHTGAPLFCTAVVLVLAPFTLEGVTAMTTVNRDETVSATKIVRATAAEVERALFEPPRFDRSIPLYLRSGFPSGVAARIERTPETTRWIIRIRGGEMRLNGLEPREGDLVLQLDEAREGRVRWRAIADDSHMAHFLSWREILVQWEPVSTEATKVTWTIRYERGLDPAWYFGPWERYGARLAADYLIDAVATP
jgi:hypothetical protein